MHRSPITVGAAGGGLATFALRLLSDAFDIDHRFIPASDSLDCSCPSEWIPKHWVIDHLSLCCGILIGLVLGPLLEFLIFIRVYLGTFARRLAVRHSGALYRVL